MIRRLLGLTQIFKMATVKNPYGRYCSIQTFSVLRLTRRLIKLRNRIALLLRNTILIKTLTLQLRRCSSRPSSSPICMKSLLNTDR